MTALPAADAQRSPLLPSNPLGQRLCETFPYRWHSISGENAAEPDWKTNTKYPLRPRVLWQGWNDPNTLVGVRFGSTTSYALVDLDRTSLYHPASNPTGLPLILAALETIGIVRYVLLRSSHSGGLHLYLPLPYAVPTFGLAQAIKQCLEAQGITLAAGQIETFPNTKAYAIPGTHIEYNAHRLPLQPDSGSCLLDLDSNPIGTSLGQFFRHWDNAAAGQDLETLHAAIAVARRNGSKRKRQRIAAVEAWRADLQTEINEGWTGSGQTNHLLKTIACYGVVFERLQSEALAEFVQTTAINAPGYETYCRHQHEITQRSILWARAAEKYWWALGSEPQRSPKHSTSNGGETSNVIPINKNQLRAEEAKQRIREGVERLQSTGQFPADASSRVRLLVREAHTSVQTLYRYRELWHPEHFTPVEETACVTAEVASDPSDAATKSPDRAKPRETAPEGELHTLEENMKCKAELVYDFPADSSVPEVSSASARVFELRRLDGQGYQLDADFLEKPHEKTP
ncbi:MAG: hypothetical protein KME43_19825 [Myxacorys chilensis ATA2-1-KO14]|jgi:hypothetical protein|nr:hypothetical protein [Myxacorys chilensis ATA2-1-KO14]